MTNSEHILLDIEGTTTSIQFVHNVLFPYARKHMGDFIRNNWSNPEVNACLKETGKQRKLNFQIDKEPSKDQFSALEEQLLAWIDSDEKIAPLKILQGILWEDGYRRKAYTAHLYDDVVPALEKWIQEGKQVSIFSSGSVKAQKLLFAHTSHGDLSSYFHRFFDPKIGAKREAKAYTEIARELETEAANVHFYSDVPQELKAAQSAGFSTTQVVRKGTVGNPSFRQIREF